MVDLETDVVPAAEVYRGDDADVETLSDSFMQAQTMVNAATERAGCAVIEIEEVVVDMGYHAAKTLELAAALSLRTYIPEPKRPHKSRRTDKPEAYRKAVVNNRRRTRRARSRKLQPLRSEHLEHSFPTFATTEGRAGVGYAVSATCRSVP